MRPDEKMQKLVAGETIISKESGNSMLPILKSRQPVRLIPIKWQDCKKNDIVFCRVRGSFYTHKVSAIDSRKGCLISNNSGHNNGWSRNVFGKVIEILPMNYKGI